MVGIAAQIAEREDGNGRFLRYRERNIHSIVLRFGLSAFDVDRCDPTNTFLGKGADEILLLAAVANSLAYCVDATGQGRFRHDAATPDRCDEVVLADDAMSIFDEIDQDVEDLRLDWNHSAGRAQFAALAVERKITE